MRWWGGEELKKNYLGALGADRKIILKWIYEIVCVDWTEFIWTWRGTNGRLLSVGNESSCSVRRVQNWYLTEELSVWQEAICCTGQRSWLLLAFTSLCQHGPVLLSRKITEDTSALKTGIYWLPSLTAFRSTRARPPAVWLYSQLYTWKFLASSILVFHNDVLQFPCKFFHSYALHNSSYRQPNVKCFIHKDSVRTSPRTQFASLIENIRLICREMKAVFVTLVLTNKRCTNQLKTGLAESFLRS